MERFNPWQTVIRPEPTLEEQVDMLEELALKKEDVSNNINMSDITNGISSQQCVSSNINKSNVTDDTLPKQCNDSSLWEGDWF